MGFFDKIFGNPKKQEADSRFQKGIWYLQSNDFENALYEFKKATEIAPELPHAWEMRGKMHRTLGNEAEALYCFDKMKELR